MCCTLQYPGEKNLKQNAWVYSDSHFSLREGSSCLLLFFLTMPWKRSHSGTLNGNKVSRGKQRQVDNLPLPDSQPRTRRKTQSGAPSSTTQSSTGSSTWSSTQNTRSTGKESLLTVEVLVNPHPPTSTSQLLTTTDISIIIQAIISALPTVRLAVHYQAQPPIQDLYLYLMKCMPTVLLVSSFS